MAETLALFVANERELASLAICSTFRAAGSDVADREVDIVPYLKVSLTFGQGAKKLVVPPTDGWRVVPQTLFI